MVSSPALDVLCTLAQTCFWLCARGATAPWGTRGQRQRAAVSEVPQARVCRRVTLRPPVFHRCDLVPFFLNFFLGYRPVHKSTGAGESEALPRYQVPEKRPVPLRCDELGRDSPLQPHGITISIHMQDTFFIFTENAVPKPLPGTALTWHSSALSCGDGQGTALDCTTKNYHRSNLAHFFRKGLVNHLQKKKKLAEDQQTVVRDRSAAAHPLQPRSDSWGRASTSVCPSWGSAKSLVT